MYLHKNIKHLRKSFGWTQKDLATKLGIGETLVGKYERKDIVPPIDKITLMVDVFGVTYGELLDEDLSQKKDLKSSNKHTEGKEEIGIVFDRLYKELEKKTIAVAKKGITIEQLLAIGADLKAKYPDAPWEEWDNIVKNIE